MLSPDFPRKMFEYATTSPEGMEWGARKMFEYATTSPRIGALLDYAVKHSVSPGIYVPLIANEIDRENRPQQNGGQP
jgi:hypothetical protein